MILAIPRISRHSELNNDMDGVIEEQILTGNSDVKGNPLDSDLYAPAEGHSYAGGFKTWLKHRREVKDKKLALKNKRLDIRALRSEGRAQAKIKRADAKQGKALAKQISAKAQVESAKALGKQDDTALVAALNQKSPGESKSEGMSSTTKILIGVGVVAVLAIGTFVIIKLRKKK